MILSNAVSSLRGRDDLTSALCGIYDAKETKVGLYTCGRYIFNFIDYRIYKCYGCQMNICPKPKKGEEDLLPPLPLDFVLARLELRQIPDTNGGLRMSIKPEPVHHHPKHEIRLLFNRCLNRNLDE